MDVSNAIIAKSDQLNAIDLVGRDVTVTVVDVKPGPADQPVHIITDVYGPTRPFKASKTALRDIVQAWGTDSTVWVGRKLTLWNDPDVLWAGQPVGGIRIRAMSHIDKAFEAKHVITRGKTKKVMIQPLAAEPDPLAQSLDDIARADSIPTLKAAWDLAGKRGLAAHPDVVAAKERRKTQLTTEES
jgi:hypothetical protein